MTITIDHKNKRKTSWDSKMSVSTVSTKHFARSETPSSILSSDSDIRFTRKLGVHYRCGCCILAGFLLFLLLAAAAVYLGHTFLSADPPGDRVFRAMFRVVRGDTFSPELADPATEQFRIRARDYRERLNLVFRRSDLRPAFLGTEVLALDGVEGQNLVVHFNLRFDPRQLEVGAPDLMTVLSKEVALEESQFLSNLTIDPNSLDIKESSAALTTPLPITTSVVTTPSSTTTPPPPRLCGPIQLEYCNKLSYNVTSYPNKLGHRSIKEVRDDVIAFRELVDAECYRLAYEFVCQLLQPSCTAHLPGETEDRMVLPCQSFCREFHAGCGNRLPDRFKDALDCRYFPEFTGPGSCNSKPGCVKELQARGLSARICDGVVDCMDLSDETSCGYCPDNHIHCGAGKVCISVDRRCDGKKDCPDGSDEKGCLTVAPSLLSVKTSPATPHHSQYYSEGYVIFNEKGEVGKICTENLNTTVPEPNREGTLNTIAASLCGVLSYKNVNFVRIQEDEEPEVQYVHMEDPSAAEITFVRAPCPKKEVLYVGCSDLECGTQSLRGTAGVQGLGKVAAYGDWPWHAALFKDGVHVCDATLVSAEWLLTTASCFQGQPKAQWVAHLGNIRLSGSSPWHQERAVVGMVKSPVEGSTVVMVKLEQPVTMSDFIHPVCLPEEGSGALLTNLSHCNTLGWARNREQLQRVQIKLSSMERCENISIPTVNSICTEPPYLTDDCNEEELAGSPMLCLLSDNKTWTLVGVSNWRIACSKSGTERPRLYDKITSNIEWIHKTMSAIS
uniref:Putative serine protease 38 n=1 Tax=Reticulitermes speratus TaxID=60591 RepID=A0A1V1FKK9_9NEOP